MTDDPTGRFEASPGVRRRWRRRQAPVLIVGFFSALVVVINVESAHSPGLWVLVALMLIGGFGWAFGYTRYRSSSTRLPAGASWAGMFSVRLPDLDRAGLIGNINVRSQRRFSFLTQGLGSLGGRLEITAQGLNFKLGRVSRFAGASGSTNISWSDIEDINVGDVPGMVNRGLGGGFRVRLKGGATVDGTFLGPRSAMLAALEASPLGRPTKDEP